MHWSFQARSGVRNAISIGEVKGQGSARYAAYFGDVRANVYANGRRHRPPALENQGGRERSRPGSLERRLFFKAGSMSRWRRGKKRTGTSATYPCCTFRGSVVALDANTGKQIWKTLRDSGDAQADPEKFHRARNSGVLAAALFGTLQPSIRNSMRCISGRATPTRSRGRKERTPSWQWIWTRAKCCG